MNIRKYRLDANLSQKELAEKVHMSHTSISHYENGTRRPNPDMLKSLASVLNVTVDQLINDTSKKEEDPSNEEIMYRNIAVPQFSKYMPKKMLLAKLILTVALINMAVLIKPDNIEAIGIFAFFYSLLLVYEIFRFIIVKPSLVHYNVKLGKKIYYLNTNEEVNYLYTIGRLVFVVIANFLLGLFIYGIASALEEGEELMVIMPLLMLIQLFVGGTILVSEVIKKGQVKTILYETFTYKRTLQLYGILCLITDGLFLLSYCIIMYYKAEIHPQLYWITLIFAPLIMVFNYLVYNVRVDDFAKYEIKVRE